MSDIWKYSLNIAGHDAIEVPIVFDAVDIPIPLNHDLFPFRWV
jgi:Asp-tRNA(Asn)/Glu-tRNA(Gln) amidotransferase A subunit family amidase